MNFTKTILNGIKYHINTIKVVADNANAAVGIIDKKMDSENPVGSGSFSMGRKNDTIIGINSHAEGHETEASGNYSHAEGYHTAAFGEGSHAEGGVTTAFGNYSHAEGWNTTASEYYSHAEGDGTTASEFGSHAEGHGTTADGMYSHAEGYGTTASGYGSHAEGYGTTAFGDCSHAEGDGTTASGDCSHVQGKYNIDDVDAEGNALNTYAHIVGNGNDSYSASNAHTLDWQGNAWYQGSVTSNGADYAEYFEWLDGNSDNEDRVGLLVTLDGDKIKLANADDEILGIISGTAAVLGDNYECEWNGKYLTDDFGRVIYDLVEEFIEVIDYIDEETNEPVMKKESVGFFKHPRINPDYDPEQTYINRANRQEWDTVGMVGKLYLRDDGTCKVNGYATTGKNGIATASDEKTNIRVLSRVNDNVVRVLMK